MSDTHTHNCVRNNGPSNAECVFKGLDLECDSCQRNEGHHKRVLGVQSERETEYIIDAILYRL